MNDFVIEPVTELSECNICMLGHEETHKQAMKVAETGDVPVITMCATHHASYLEYESRTEGHD